jgi:predicted nucleotidyltransferase component of viral defense system
MISFEEIKNHYPEKETRFPQSILKEYLQYKILDIIFSSPYGEKLVFIGGTAVRIVFGGDRFSEDLDFDNCGLSKKEFDELTDYIKKELERDGLQVEFRNTFKDVYHCYLKFPKILFNNKLSPLQDEKILIRLDSFCVKEFGKTETQIISKADIFAEIKTYSKEMILSQKIEALFNRKRSKGRDIYDIVYLFSQTNPDFQYLNKTLKISKKETLLKKMRGLFSDKELSELAQDVKPLLINPKNAARVEKFNLWIESIDKK